MNNQTTTKTALDNPSLFLTDYASYNEGKQFEFGHWVDLTEFSDANEFLEYISNHFAEADEKSPLPFGAKREETMLTDYENFPSQLYSESLSSKELEQLYEWINLDDDDKIKLAYLLEDGQKFDYAIDHVEDVYLTEFNYTFNEKYDLFEQYYPDAEKLSNSNDYVTIDYDRFIKDEFNEFSYNGVNYLVQFNA